MLPLIFLTSNQIEDPVAYRQMLLDNTAYIQEPWCGFSPERKAKWADFRATLQALPEQEGWPTSVVWPIAPGTLEQMLGEPPTVCPAPPAV